MIAQVVGAAAVLITTGYLLFGGKKKVAPAPNPAPNPKPDPAPAPDMSNVCITSDAGLTLKNAQTVLKSLKYDIGSTGADGVCGPKTKAATLAFQKDINAGKYDDSGRKLKESGIVDKDTALALYNFKPVSLVPVHSYTDKNGQAWNVENPAAGFFRAYVSDPIAPPYINQSVTGYSEPQVNNAIEITASSVASQLGAS